MSGALVLASSALVEVPEGHLQPSPPAAQPPQPPLPPAPVLQINNTYTGPTYINHGTVNNGDVNNGVVNNSQFQGDVNLGVVNNTVMGGLNQGIVNQQQNNLSHRSLHNNFTNNNSLTLVDSSRGPMPIAERADDGPPALPPPRPQLQLCDRTDHFPVTRSQVRQSQKLLDDQYAAAAAQHRRASQLSQDGGDSRGKRSRDTQDVLHSDEPTPDNESDTQVAADVDPQDSDSDGAPSPQ